MANNAELIALLETEKSGFTLVRAEAEKAMRRMDADSCQALAEELYGAEAHQARMFAVLVLGHLAAARPAAYDFLRTRAVHDPDWRTQEMLARSFDQYCKDNGYRASLPVIEEWLGAPEANRRRAASEGLRIWTARPYFKEHPETAVALLAALRADPSEYVRRSAGNALRDISRRHAELVGRELDTWDLTDRSVAFTHKLASRFVGQAGSTGKVKQ